MKHTGEKLLQCDECDVAFTDFAHLEQHKKMHAAEKPLPSDEISRSSEEKALPCDEKSGSSDEKPLPSDEISRSSDEEPLPSDEISRSPDEKPLPCEKESGSSDEKPPPGDQISGSESFDEPQDEKSQALITSTEAGGGMLEPRQWVVVEGECVPIKQELDDEEDNNDEADINEEADINDEADSSFTIKQEAQYDSESSD